MKKRKLPEEIKIGTLIGRRRIIKKIKRGPYTYVDAQCTCDSQTIRRGIPLAQLIRGQALSCGCWPQEIRAAEQLTWERFRSALLQLRKPMQLERENILKRFFPAYTPKRPSNV